VEGSIGKGLLSMQVARYRLDVYMCGNTGMFSLESFLRTSFATSLPNILYQIFLSVKSYLTKRNVW
jgi:hypothetical protein